MQKRDTGFVLENSKRLVRASVAARAKELQSEIPVAPKPKARPAKVTDPAPNIAPPIAEPPVPGAPVEEPVTDSNTPADNS